MHLHHCLIIGRVSKTGPKLSYTASGTPVCTLVVEVDDLGKGGDICTTDRPCEVTGMSAERITADIEPGDEIQMAGKRTYKCVVDPKTSANVSRPMVSTSGMAQRLPSAAVPEHAHASSDHGGPLEDPPAVKQGRPREAQWQPSHP